MNKTKIEWVKNPDGSQGYTRNPVKGLCKNNCSYCYAKRIYKRFNWNPEIRIDWTVMDEIYKLKDHSTFFIGSMHDIFGPWIPSNWIEGIIDYAKIFPYHRFIFLTKFPERYKYFDFPKNCWLGTTITGEENIDELGERMWLFTLLNKDNIKFVSYEPLLNYRVVYTRYMTMIDWIIIGGLTPKPVHKKEWVIDIIKRARLWNVPIFIKGNLRWPEKIQNFPNIS